MKNKGFTLAEVLITLGVIGVVAALTLSAIVQNYKKKVTSAKLKKFYSMMSQAIVMSEIDNGPSEDWTKEDMAKDETGKIVVDEQQKRALEYYEKYLKPYLKNVETYNNKSSDITVILSDGSMFVFNNGACAHISYDINGEREPNEGGRDEFHFLICPKSLKSRFGGRNSTQKSLISYVTTSLVPHETREEAISVCKNATYSCSYLLMMDGFEFKDDYPFKL